MKQKILISVFAALALSGIAQADGTVEQIVCHAEAGETINVLLWTPHQIGQPVHCIRAGNLAGDANCAPNGGWGLLSDDEVPELLSVTMEWKTAHQHQMGKLTAIAGPKTVRFNAQHGEGTGSNLSYEWKFTLDRRTGSATWFTKDGDRVPYSCDMQS